METNGKLRQIDPIFLLLFGSDAVIAGSSPEFKLYHQNKKNVFVLNVSQNSAQVAHIGHIKVAYNDSLQNVMLIRTVCILYTECI